MPLKILYIFLCFVSVHRSFGNGLDDAEQDIVQSLIANQTGLSSIPEISPDNSNVTRRNLPYDRNENEECEKAVTLKRTLKLLISLLSDSASTNSKTTHVLENLKDLLKNTPAGDAEVIDKIDDLVRTLDKYKESGDINDHVPLRSLTENPKKDGLELDSSLKFNLEIPALANIYCTKQLFNILKATEQAYLNLARNPVCEIDISDLPTIPNINSNLLNPNLLFDDYGMSSNKIPNSQNCEKCYPDKNIVTPYYYPVFIDVNTDKNTQPPYDIESGPVRPVNVNPVSPNYYPYSSDQVLTVDVNPNKNPGTTHYYPEFFGVKPDKYPLLQDNNAHGPVLNYYPELFDIKPDKNPLLQDYNTHGPGPNYYLELFDVKPDKNPLLQDHNAHGPGPNNYADFFHVKPDKNPLLQDYNAHGPGPNNYPDFFHVKPDKNLLLQDYNTHGPGPNYYPEFFDVEPNKNSFLQDYNTHVPGPNNYLELFDVKPGKNPLLQDNNAHGPVLNYYPELFDVKPDKNPLLQDYNTQCVLSMACHSPGPNYYPELFDVNPDVTPDKNPLLQDYNTHGPEPNYYPEFFDVKPDKNPLLQDYYPYYSPGQVQLVDINPDKNPYYPELFDVTPEKKPISPDYKPYGPGDVWSDKTPVTPYYYPEYVDVNLDKNPVAPYYNPDSIPLGPVNAWDKNPFPYDAAPETLPLNPIFPYVPKIPGYPNPISEKQNILPFEITPEAVNFVYPNLYNFPNQSKPFDFSENVIEPNVPIYQYPIFPPKEITPLNPSSIISKHPEHDYGVYPHIANYVQPPINSIFPFSSKIPTYTNTEPLYPDNEVPQLPPMNNIPVNAWETSIPPDENQNILDYSYQNILNNYPIEISSLKPNYLPNVIPEYNIQSNNQYTSYPFYPSNKHDVSPLNSYVPDQFKPQQPLPNPGPLINVVPKPNELKPPLKLLGFVREAIDIIQAVVPVVKFDRPTLHIIAKIKSILVPKDEDITHEQYSTILDLFGKVIEFVKQLEYYKQIKDIIDLHAVSNRQKLETEKIVELTYLLKQPKPVVYYPYYYVKYSMPYRHFMIVANNLLRQKPELRDKPNELYEELLALSNVVDLSPDLKTYNKEDLLKLTLNAGSLVDTKFIEENASLREQLNMLKNITSDLTTDEILDLKESNNKYQHLADTESDNEASVKPFVLRDKKEADPNIIIGMQRLNDIFNTPNSHSSTFNSDKLRADILRGGKDSVNDHLRNAINNRDENNPPENNWIQKLVEATKDASHPPNVMSSNGYVRIDNQKITMNSGSGNRQDAVSVFNPKSTMKVASSNSRDIGINVKSNPNDVNEFLKRYNGPNLINYDSQKITLNSGDSNYQSDIKITNPKLMLNEYNAQESDEDDLESVTEQDSLAIESNPPLKWEQLDTYKPTPRPRSTKNNKINNKAASNQVGVINHKVDDEQHLVMPNQPISSYGNSKLYYGMSSKPHQIEVVNGNEPSLISNDPAAVPGSVAYYGINGMGMPNQVEGINHEEQLLISNNPTALPGSVAYYVINGMGMPNQVGGKNHEDQLLISNNPTAVPGSVVYYAMNGIGMPNQIGGKNQEEQLLISNNPTAVPGSVVYYAINGMGMPNQVGGKKHEDQVLISNNPTAVPGSVVYYAMNGIGIPNQIGGKNREEQLLISNNPTAAPGSVAAYYEINGMGKPNQVGGKNHEEQLLTSNNPTPAPGSVDYYAMNGMGMPNQVEGLNNEEQLLMSNNPTSAPGSVAYYGINGMGMPNQVVGKNHEEQLLISNNPTPAPGSLDYYATNGMGMPNQVGGINNEEQLLISNNPTAAPGSVAYYGINGMGMPNQIGGINNEEQLLISNDPTAVPEGLLYYGMNSVVANQGGVLGTQSTILHQDAEQLFPYELEHIIDAEPDSNRLNGESIKESVFDDIQLTEKMKYNGNRSVGGGQGVINNVLQSITGHDHVLQYTVDSQEQLNLNNNGLYSADANQEMIEQRNSENSYLAMVGQNNYENDLYDYQQNLGNLGPYSLGNAMGQNIQSTVVHHIGAPYSAGHNVVGYGSGGDMLGQKLVIQSVPVVYKRPYSYHQRITARRPVVVG